MTEDLSSRVAILETIYKINAKLRSIQDPDEAFNAIAAEIKAVSEADFVAMFVLERDRANLRLAGVAGLGTNTTKRLPPVKIDVGFRRTVTKMEGIKVMRFSSPEEFPKVGQPIALELGIEKGLVCPMFLHGDVLGYIAVCSVAGGADISQALEQFMESISTDLALLVDNIRAADDVRRSRDETERILSMAPIGIFTCDARGIFMSANKQMLSMLDKSTEQEIIGTSAFEIPVISRSGMDALLMQGMEGHYAEKADLHFVPHQDKALYLHVKVTPLKSTSDQIQGVLVVAMDISSKVRLQNQLERSYERLTQTFQEMERVTTMKTQFIDTVSHELRTPLTVMRGYIDLVETEYAPKMDPKFAAKIKTIKANTDKLYGLVESMLDVSRLEKGSMQIHPELVNLDAILDEVVKARMNDAELKKQFLQLEIEGKLPPIMADRRRIKDVFDNIIDNALRYTQEGGKIHVCARDEGRIIHIWVRDNGVGIPLENLGKIFERFHIIAEDPLSHQDNRLGLGLPISKGIIEAHHGRMWVESQVGKGSVFHIDLPKEPPR